MISGQSCQTGEQMTAVGQMKVQVNYDKTNSAMGTVTDVYKFVFQSQQLHV